jgi:hypothetical protein
MRRLYRKRTRIEPDTRREAIAMTKPSVPCPPRLRATRTGAAVLALAAPAALAQGTPQQVVRGPVATYWVTASTTSGLGAMGAGGSGMGAMLGMLTGRGGGPTRSLDLRLGSTQAAAGPPQAAHLIPPGMAMGAQLPLLTPEPAKAAPPREEREERELPQGVERPKGRMLIFWGCGERAGPGQPLIIDFSKVAAGQQVPNLVSRPLRLPRGPAYGSSRTFGTWPNERDSQPVPPQASLLGEHQIKGNYSPDIRFSVERNDFMPPVDLAQAKTASEAQQLSWKPVTGATGYFMSAFGAGAGAGGDAVDMVFWTSSAVQEMGGSLMDHVPPPEVARLIRERIVLPPDRTDCTVPAEVTRAMPMGMLNFIAYGEEMNFANPPRPSDPKVPWDIQWAVKVRLKSTSMVPLGEGMAGMMGGGGGRTRGATTPAAPAPARAGDAAPAPAAGTSPAADGGGQPPSQGSTIPSLPGNASEAVDQGVRVLRGLFGR